MLIVNGYAVQSGISYRKKKLIMEKYKTQAFEDIVPDLRLTNLNLLCDLNELRH
jgi:hypothetical protein